MNSYQKIFAFCAGADIPTLSDATSSERNKFVTLGMTVLIPTFLGMWSGGYAAFLITNAIFPSFAFGLLWGLIIFIIDRAVVSSSSDSLLPAFGRLCLAILIGLVVSLPLEIKIFEDAIKEEMNRQSAHEIATIRAFYYPKIKAIEADEKRREEGVAALRDLYLRETDGSGGTGERGYSTIAKIKQQEYEQAKNSLLAFKQGQIAERTEILRMEKEEISRLEQNQANGLLGQWKTLGQISEREPFVRYSSWALTLLLVFIEVIPLLVKISNSGGLYKRLIDIEERSTIAVAEEISIARTQVKVSEEIRKQQEQLHRSALEKATEQAQFYTDLASIYMQKLLDIAKLEKEFTEKLSHLSAPEGRAAGITDKIQNLTDFYMDKVYESPIKTEELTDLVS